MFWQADLETLSRSDLAELQLQRLQKTVRGVYSRSPFYQAKFKAMGLKPGDIRTLKDLRLLPMTTREDLRDAYPYGLLCVGREQAVRLHTSSGTTGKPKAIFYSQRDIQRASERIARSLVMTGGTAGDVFQNMMTYGLFTGGLIMHYGAEKVGMLVIPSGPGNSERQLMLMQDFGTTLVHCTPSFALYFADVLEKKGINPRKDLKLRKAYVGAEPYTKETRRKIEAIYGIDVYNSYGLTEMNGPGVAFECQYKDGMHLWEDHMLMEIVDPQSGRVLPDGEQGELVLTSLYNEAMPILRYRTRDITSIIHERCRCGRTHGRISRFTGRADDMLIVRGVNIFPQQIERVLMGIAALGRNYQIVLEGIDEMTVRVELAASSFDGKLERLVNLRTEVMEKLRTETMVKPVVELVPPGTLPVSEGKAQRVIDKRQF